MLLKEAFQSLAHELNFNEVNPFASSANCILPAHFIFVSTMSELDYFDSLISFGPLTQNMHWLWPNAYSIKRINLLQLPS
jgi:hypothetical protein